MVMSWINQKLFFCFSPTIFTHVPFFPPVRYELLMSGVNLK